jgi:hypothetical protein
MDLAIVFSPASSFGSGKNVLFFHIQLSISRQLRGFLEADI